MGPSNPSFDDPILESIDVRQIYDKFAEKKGGLKELYEKGPRGAFFLVKFWVRHFMFFKSNHQQKLRVVSDWLSIYQLAT